MTPLQAAINEQIAAERAARSPEDQAAIDRIHAAFEQGRNRRHPLERILQLMADSGRALIVDEGVVIVEPLVEVEQIVRSDGSSRVAA